MASGKMAQAELPDVDTLRQLMRAQLAVEPLTGFAVRMAVAHIGQASFDDEAAHAMEDELRTAVLVALAKSAVPEVAELARSALSTGDIEFSRWCA